MADTKSKEVEDMRTSGRFPMTVVTETNEEGRFEQPVAEAASEFSYESIETGLKPEENILDLALDGAEFFGESLSQVIETEGLTKQSFQTFVTVEFYDHETKSTDVQEGFKPDYST